MKRLMKKTKSKNINELSRNIAFKKSEWHEKRAIKMSSSDSEQDESVGTASVGGATAQTEQSSPAATAEVSEEPANHHESFEFALKPLKPKFGCEKNKKKGTLDRFNYYCFDSETSISAAPTHPSVFLSQVEHYQEKKIKPILLHSGSPYSYCASSPPAASFTRLNNNVFMDQVQLKKSSSKLHLQSLKTFVPLSQPIQADVFNVMTESNPTTQTTVLNNIPQPLHGTSNWKTKKNLTFKEPVVEGCDSPGHPRHMPPPAFRESPPLLSCHEAENLEEKVASVSELKDLDHEYEYFYDFTRTEIDQIQRRRGRLHPLRDLDMERGAENDVVSRTRAKIVCTLFPLEDSGTVPSNALEVDAEELKQKQAQPLQLDYNDRGLTQAAFAVQLPYRDTTGRAITPAFEVSDADDYLELLVVVASEKKEQEKSQLRSEEGKLPAPLQELQEENAIEVRINPDLQDINNVTGSSRKEVLTAALEMRNGSRAVSAGASPSISAFTHIRTNIHSALSYPVLQERVIFYGSKFSRANNNNCSSACPTEVKKMRRNSIRASFSHPSLQLGLGSIPNNPARAPLQFNTPLRMVSEVAVSDSIPSENADPESISDFQGTSKSETRSHSSDPICPVNPIQSTTPRPVIYSPGRVPGSNNREMSTLLGFAGSEKQEDGMRMPTYTTVITTSTPTATTTPTPQPEVSDRRKGVKSPGRKADSHTNSSQKGVNGDEEDSDSVKLENIRIRPESVHKMLRLQQEILSQPDKYRDPDRFDAFDLVELDYNGMERYLKFLVFHSLLMDQQERRARRNGSYPDDEDVKSRKAQEEGNSSSILLFEEENSIKGLCGRIKNFFTLTLNPGRFCRKLKSSVSPASDEDPDEEFTTTDDDEESTATQESTTISTRESYRRRKQFQCEIEGREVTESESSYSTYDTTESESLATTAETGQEEMMMTMMGTKRDVLSSPYCWHDTNKKNTTPTATPGLRAQDLGLELLRKDSSSTSVTSKGNDLIIKRGKGRTKAGKSTASPPPDETPRDEEDEEGGRKTTEHINKSNADDNERHKCNSVKSPS